jgi:hypothetical protein
MLLIKGILKELIKKIKKRREIKRKREINKVDLL